MCYNVVIRTASGGTMLCGVCATSESDALRKLAMLPLAGRPEIVSITPVR